MRVVCSFFFFLGAALHFLCLFGGGTILCSAPDATCYMGEMV